MNIALSDGQVLHLRAPVIRQVDIINVILQTDQGEKEVVLHKVLVGCIQVETKVIPLYCIGKKQVSISGIHQGPITWVQVIGEVFSGGNITNHAKGLHQTVVVSVPVETGRKGGS